MCVSWLNLFAVSDELSCTLLTRAKTRALSLYCCGKCRLVMTHILRYHKQRTQDGETALMYAASRGHVDCARLLVGAGADKDARCNVRGLRCCSAVVRKLVLFCADSFDDAISPFVFQEFISPASVHCVALHFASTVRMYDCCNCIAQNGWTALMWAAKKRHIDCARLLLDGGANLEAKNNVGISAAVLSNC